MNVHGAKNEVSKVDVIDKYCWAKKSIWRGHNFFSYISLSKFDSQVPLKERIDALVYTG